MPPALAANPEKEKRLKNILTFGTALESQLPSSATSKAPSNLQDDLEKQISSFPNKFGSASSSRCEEVDRCGTSLWNLCTRLRRDVEPDRPQDAPTILLLARVFAFFLLDCAYQCGKATSGNLPRLMKIGIKAGKSCLEIKQYNVATQVLGKVGGYEELVKSAASELTSDDKEACETLLAEYYILRTAVAWYSDRSDQDSVAEFMFNKTISFGQYFDHNTSESLADVLYEMGKDMLGKPDYKMAIKWLGRAYEVLNGQELDKLSMDAGELRISIIQSGIRACISIKDKESIEQARRWLGLLEHELGDRLVVLLLKLEMLEIPTDDYFDCNAYSDVIQKMARSLALNDANFRLIMFHIRKLKEKSPSLACQALDELLDLRVLREDREEWIEKVLITRLWMTLGHRDDGETLEFLDKMFTKLQNNLTKPIGSPATLAAHTLIWKRIESNYGQNDFEMAENWCHLAMHPLFEKSGELNMARISRKLLLCALARKDIGNAKEIFSSMSDMGKNETMSRFLMYKIAVRCGDTGLAAECLQTISSSTTTDPTILYACCLDAQNAGNKPQLLATLQLVLEKYGYGAPSGVHLPALLRLTISLMVHSIEEDSGPGTNFLASGNMVHKLCTIFEKAASAMKKARTSVKTADAVWTLDELDWFSKNSYNTAIKHLWSWHPRQSLRILQTCILVIDQYPPGINEQISNDLFLRKMFCEFSAATALVSLARTEDNIEAQLQDYLNLRKHVDSFDNLLQSKIEIMGEEEQKDLNRKLSVLAAFDFEAACHLKAWDDLGDSILKADGCKNSQVYEIMADIILCSQAPTEIKYPTPERQIYADFSLVLISAMKKIINAAWDLESLDIYKLAKYMRCLFRVAMTDNMSVAKELLDQVEAHAADCAETDQPYPSEELEWIATRAFNHAVDLYCSSDDDGCRNWAGRALNIAHYCGDEGSLERLLQSKLIGLKFDS